MGRTLGLAVVLAITCGCGTDESREPANRVDFLLEIDLNGNRAFAMTFNSRNDLVVSGTGQNKKAAVSRWDGERNAKIDVAEQVWLERSPSGEIFGIGRTRLFSFGTDA